MAIVLLHCSGSSGAQWRALMAQQGARHRVAAPDLTSPGTLASEAAAIRSLMGRLDEPVHLVGHSYGGAVALHIARTRPERVRSLTLVEPSAFHLLRGGEAMDAVAPSEIIEVALDVRLRAAMPQAKFEVVPDAGHMLPIRHRDQVNALIAEHIHRNTDPQGVHHAKLAA